MKDRLTKYWKFLHTRFSIMRLFVAGFLFVILFLDENSIVRSMEYSRKISELEKEIDHYKEVISESQSHLNELRSNEENLEKFAREQYLMKKSDEDIYIISRN